MGNLERNIEAEREPLPFVSNNLDSSVVEYDILSKDEIVQGGKNILGEILNKGRVGVESPAIGDEVPERFRKKGRPKIDVSQKALKVSVSLPKRIGDELKDLYKGKKLSMAVQESCWGHIYIRRAQLRQIEELKKELDEIGSMIELYDTKRKWDDIKPIVRELKSKVQNFLKLVRFIGLVQKVPDKNNPKMLTLVDFLYDGLPAKYQRVYQFCQYWELNGYPDALF